MRDIFFFHKVESHLPQTAALRTSTCEVCVGYIFRIKVLLLCNRIFTGTLTDSEKCELQTIDLIHEFQTGIPVPNKSPLREFIRVG